MIDLSMAFLLSASSVLSAAMLAVLALRRPVRRLAGAEAAYAAWLLVPLALLVLALPKLPPEVAAASDPVPALAATAAAETTQVAPGVPAFEPEATRRSLTPILLAAWAVGALALGGWMWRRHRRYLDSLQLRGAGRAWRARAGAQPGVLGTWRPRLVLPVDFAQRFAAGERALILAHERVHAQRGDPRWNALAATLLAAQWFNPVAWWAHAAFRLDQELACDATVLRRKAADVVRYARLLARSAGWVPSTPLASHWLDRHPAIERLEMLRHHQRCNLRWRSPVLLAVAVGAFGAAHAARPADPFPTGHSPAPMDARDTTRIPILVDARPAVTAQRVVLAADGPAWTSQRAPSPVWTGVGSGSPSSRPPARRAPGDATPPARGIAGPASIASAPAIDDTDPAVPAPPGIDGDLGRYPGVAAGAVDATGPSDAAVGLVTAANGAGETAVAPPRVIDSDWRVPGSESLPPWPVDAKPVQVVLTLRIDARGRLTGARVEHSPGEAYARAALRWVRAARYGAARTASGERVAGELPLLVTIAPPRWVTPNPAISAQAWSTNRRI